MFPLLIVALTALVGRAAADCPWADPFCSCVMDVDFRMPNFTHLLTRQREPPLMQNVPLTLSRGANFWGVLPISDMITLLKRTIPRSEHNCAWPLMRGRTVRSYANNPKHPLHGTFKACEHVPWPEWPSADEDTHSFVFAAFEDLAAIPSRDLSGLPALRAFRSKYSGSVGAHLSACVAAQPCNQHVFTGFDNVNYMRFYINWGLGFADLRIKPRATFMSPVADNEPPHWLYGSGPPDAWHRNPWDSGGLGRTAKIHNLANTVLTGTSYVEGPMQGGFGHNIVSLHNGTVKWDFGYQKWSWVLARDMLHRALSTELRNVPNINMWGKIKLPFRSKALSVKGMDFKGASTLSRASDCNWWITAPSMRVSLPKFVEHIRPLGRLLQRVFSDTGRSGAYVTGLYLAGVHHGVSVKITIGQGLTLRPGPAKVVQFDRLDGPFDVIFSTVTGASAFNDSITLNYVPSWWWDPLPIQRRTITFCEHNIHCPQGVFFSDLDNFAFVWNCDAKLGVCMPQQVKKSSAGGGGARPPPDDELPTSPPLFEDAASSPAVGQRCEWTSLGDDTCPEGLVCAEDEFTGRLRCVPFEGGIK